MKKLILAASLMVSAVFASFAGIIINYNIDPPWPYASFTFDSDGEYGLLFGDVYASNFGYFFIDDPGTLIAGTLTGNTSDYFSSNDIHGNGGISLADTNTGYLGEFKAGDTICIYIDLGGFYYNNSYILDTTGAVMWADPGDGRTVIMWIAPDFHYQIVELGSPISGEPLPGVIAALAIGGCAFLSRKVRKSIKK